MLFLYNITIKDNNEGLISLISVFNLFCLFYNFPVLNSRYHETNVLIIYLVNLFAFLFTLKANATKTELFHFKIFLNLLVIWSSQSFVRVGCSVKMKSTHQFNNWTKKKKVTLWHSNSNLFFFGSSKINTKKTNIVFNS